MNKDIESNFFLLVKSNKNKAFQLIFDSYWQRLYCQAYKKVQSKDIAKDLVQDSFVSLWGKIDLLDNEGNVLAYLCAILRNKILKLYEKDEVRLRYAYNLSSNGVILDYHSQNSLLEKELMAVIDAEVMRMPPRMREIYIMKKEDDLSIKQIANNLSLSEQTIKNQLQTAYQRLKVRISDYDSSMVSITILAILAKIL